ncbi:5'-3' exonuclease H3TH domain-containing protein [Paracoccus litorisediminis]|uniref:5'-3' exonuclease n=1 Tax=Paracoccus litorisediminis TaxID=2006130 RepID=UPI00372FB4DD
MSHIVLIDGTNLCRRAWSVAPKEKDAEGGEIGIMRLAPLMLLKLMGRMTHGAHVPTHMAMLFDGDRNGTWRRALHSGYKAVREDYEQDYLDQVEVIRNWCDSVGLAQCSSATHEADDLIASLALDANRDGMRVSIISSDKDLMQLIRPGIMQLSPIADKWYNAAAVVEKFGVGPDLLGDLLALAGDRVDGIPGAPGIGLDTARKILLEYGSLDDALDDPSRVARPSARKSLEIHAEQIRLSRRLVELDAFGAVPGFRPAEAVMPDRARAAAVMEALIEARLREEMPAP